VVGGLSKVVVAMDWTDFDDDHTTLCVYLVTRAGRALPLLMGAFEFLLRQHEFFGAIFAAT
jgi:hypothetical protein